MSLKRKNIAEVMKEAGTLKSDLMFFIPSQQGRTLFIILLHYCTLLDHRFDLSLLFFPLILSLGGWRAAVLLNPAMARLGSDRSSAPQLHAEERPDVGRRWRNEPRKQETAPHAIGIVFENRKATRFPAHGPFPVARPEGGGPVFDSCWERDPCFSVQRRPPLKVQDIPGASYR